MPLMSIRKIYYLLPPAARILARKLVFLPHDLMAGLSKSERLHPPRRLIYTGGGDFVETGDRFVKYFIEHGGLDKNDNVLDIGSGIGRLAIPLTSYLSGDASYNGFDVIAQGVDWCKENISVKHRHFNFHHIELKNDLYRNDGSEAKEYRFPLEDQSQDFIFLISVFTHLVPEEMENYLSEIGRLLDSDKSCFATFFILDKENENRNPSFNFNYEYGHYSLMDDKVKSANVAFEKDYLFKQIEKNHMHVEKYFPGHWRMPGGEKGDALDFQDILVLKKK
jgi:ubiquinone/menaquinone biosynthesis C-methylase UbiE